MSLSKDILERIIVASSNSDKPLDDETIQTIMTENGENPSDGVKRHTELRKKWIEESVDKSGVPPFIIPS